MADQLSPVTSLPDLATHNHSENTRPHVSGSERPRKSEAAIPEKWVLAHSNFTHLMASMRPFLRPL